MGPTFNALFLDIPYLADSAWRHLEYRLNAECTYAPGTAPVIAGRAFWRKPPFWFFALTIFFVSYGPTWTGLCALAPPALTVLARMALGVAIALAVAYTGWHLVRKAVGRIRARFAVLAGKGEVITPLRKALVYGLILGCIGFILAGVLWADGYMFFYKPDADDRACAQNPLAAWQLATCVAALVASAALSGRVDVRGNLVSQAGILAAVALIHWFLLSTPDARQAADIPYRHFFAAFAPCILGVIAFAPWAADFALDGNAGRRCALSDHIRERFRKLLNATELFVRRDDPALNGRSLFHALIYGPAYHPLHVLLFPALVALVVPAKWLLLATAGAVLACSMIVVWASISERWQQFTTYVERWFLRGTPLLISVFVIVLATLRVVQFDYVSTLLDAIPFGMVFGLVIMYYVLFWLVEYWMSRIAAAHLLGVLGPARDDTWVPYLPAFPRDPQVIRVAVPGEYVASHGTGRFAAIGTMTDNATRAFHTYSLVELFTVLGQHGGTREDQDHATEINQRVGSYFFILNALLFAVIALFTGAHLYVQLANNAVEPVAKAVAVADGNNAAAPGPLVDLGGMLEKQAKRQRPAIVVVGSGGGTRAALYTASVLKGLHRLGADCDIVLVSGVSGGGVALAYFAAEYAKLTGRDAALADRCPDQDTAATRADNDWEVFSHELKRPFIEDVLNGATEWRVFRTTALSALLAESFEDRLPALKLTLGQTGGTALILNSAVVGHPAEESRTLQATMDPAPDCAEAERPYQVMNGGRLIFTNVRETAGFPVAESRVPDVRLPYYIVRDGGLELAQAAALNANFPPVFPNARVQVASDPAQAASCPYRSYFVTDGGAEENLGLISALYALDSALGKLQGQPLPAIHLVLAEASAVSYDYSQDRGLSALFGGSRERLAGGLTEELVNKVQRHLQNLGATHPLLHVHYLPLPLAFRARGGFGTHWMYAKEFHLNDPRPRSATALNFLPSAALSEHKAAINRDDMELLWTALHDPAKAYFCDIEKFKPAGDAAKVRGWICGTTPGAGAGPRDLHLEEWARVIDELGPPPKPQ